MGDPHYVEVEGVPWCRLDCRLTTHYYGAAKRIDGCAHANRGSAETHAAALRDLYPGLVVRCVPGHCPAYAEDQRDYEERCRP
jgi:hypothetical protein